VSSAPTASSRDRRRKKGLRRATSSEDWHRGHQGLDVAARPEKPSREGATSDRDQTPGNAQPIPIEVTRDEVHPDVPAAFMLDATPDISGTRMGRETDHDIRRACRPFVERHEALLYDKSAANPVARSISYQDGERVPARRQHDRLHARPGIPIRSGLSRHRGQLVHEHPMGVSPPEQRQRRRRFSLGAMQDQTAPTSSGETTFGKVSSSRCTASAAARASRSRRSLLHAVGPAHSASVDESFRRVLTFHAARSGLNRGAQCERL